MARLNQKLVPSASKSYRNLIPNCDIRSMYALAPKKSEVSPRWKNASSFKSSTTSAYLVLEVQIILVFLNGKCIVTKRTPIYQEVVGLQPD